MHVQSKTIDANAVYARQPDYETLDISMQDGGSPGHEAMSESAFGDFDEIQYSARKRRRIDNPVSQADREHQLWADELLDYFMLQDNAIDGYTSPPVPPHNADLNRPIDEKGHTALHWGAAMGDLEVVKDLLRRGASPDVQSKNGETPLMRAIAFTNNYDRQNMEKLSSLLIHTVSMQEWSGNTVFHRIVNTTERKSKYQCARYYLDSILNKMGEVMSPPAIEKVLNEVDHNGDTAITIAARNGARKCVRSLIGRNADVSIRNNMGETADDLIVQLNHRRHERNSHNRQLSSSPFQGDGHHLTAGGAVQPYTNGIGGSAGFDHILSQSSLNGSAVGLEAGAGFYKSEAALALESSIFPALLGKTKSLASGFDAELAEKEAEYAEAERVVELRRNELELLKRQHEELRMRNEEQTGGLLPDDEKLVEELDELMAECAELIAQEEELELSQRLAEGEDVQTPPHDEDLLMDYDGEDAVYQKAELVMQLRELAVEHSGLIKQIAQRLASAGVADKQQEYKRLITGALQLRQEEVEAMLPEIFAELEEAQGADVGA